MRGPEVDSLAWAGAPPASPGEEAGRQARPPRHRKEDQGTLSVSKDAAAHNENSGRGGMRPSKVVEGGGFLSAVGESGQVGEDVVRFLGVLQRDPNSSVASVRMGRSDLFRCVRGVGIRNLLAGKILRRGMATGVARGRGQYSLFGAVSFGGCGVCVGPWLIHKRVLFRVDNMAVVQVINRQSAREAQVLQLLRVFVLECLRRDIYFRARHVPG
ncbi:hypothetical protein NDU88_002631 [Pleurodeles waltl]|uniref:Uncharacterized protein n=1 Tax=Pleurodeles waltl TaxID=8319 RepID=A0AAV7M8R3_PLEWA|nr:hypothetical protein NDU88_002631 [Pleurodeles waltl]